MKRAMIALGALAAAGGVALMYVPTNEELTVAICEEHPDNSICGEAELYPPVANDDYFGMDYQGKNMLDNDDHGGGEAYALAQRGPNNGTVRINADGTFIYAPNDGFIGCDNFRYQISNDAYVGNKGQVEVCVSDDVIDPPIDPCDVDPTLPECVIPEYPDRAPPPEDCELIEHHEAFPECKVTYTPVLLPRSEWTRREFALPIHDGDSPKVILQARETLRAAASRLADLSPDGGVIEVPWSVDTVQCDMLNMKQTRLTKLSVIGTRGPAGQMPRFYCRRGNAEGDDRFPDGTVVGVGGTFFQQGRTENPDKTDIYTYAYIEGLHVDGYSNWFTSNQSGDLTVVNVYAHHATSNGFSSSQIYNDAKFSPIGTRLSIAGSEIAMGGQGNTEHCIYYHGSFKPGVDRELYMTGNLIHSCNWSSSIKYIADYADIDGNRLLKTLATDPTYTRRHSQYLVDGPSTSESYIRNNTFTQNRPYVTTPGSPAIGIRARKSYYGSLYPKPGGWENDGSRQDPPIPYPDGTYWSDGYWNDVSGQQILPFIIEGNSFVSSGYKADKNVAETASGSYPHYTYTLGGAACFMDIPDGWTERSVVVSLGNTFESYVERYSLDIAGSKLKNGDLDPCGNVFNGEDRLVYDQFDTTGDSQ